MERDIARHGSKPLMQKAQKEGIYASFMPTGMIVTRLDQGLTLPPKIHPETLADNGETHMKPTPKEQATKDSTLDAHDHHLIDNLSEENARKNAIDCTNETQQEHTGKVYDQCQQIELNTHYWHEKLTDGTSSFPNLGKKQPGFYSSSGAHDHASHLLPGCLLAKTQSVGCQGSIDSKSANKLQLAAINGEISNVWPTGGRAMPGPPRPSQDQVPRTQKPEDGSVDLLYNRECITVIDQPVVTKNLPALQRDGLPDGGTGNRGSELTVSSDPLLEEPALYPESVGESERLAESVSISLTPESEVNMAAGKATRIVSASEQLQDEKSQDEKLRYGQLQDKIHTYGQVLVSMVEEETKMESDGSCGCGVGSPNAGGVKTRLYSPVYKPSRTNCSSQVNTTIATTISNSPAPRHISATLQHGPLSTLYSARPQLLALRSYIATAPMVSPEMEKINQLIVAAMDGDISLERNPNFEAQLEAILDRMLTDEEFLKGVIAFCISKLGSCSPSSAQGAFRYVHTTASKAPGPKFNMKTCTFEELKEEYIANKALAKKKHKLLLQSTLKCDKLEEKMKALKAERAYWRGVGLKMPGSKGVVNLSEKWLCTSCGLVNGSWADLEEWVPNESPKGARTASGEPGITANNENTWASTPFCRYCGGHKSGSLPEKNAESPSKRKLAYATEGNSIAYFKDQFKRHCKNIESGLKSSGGVIPNTHTFRVELGDSPDGAPGTLSQQAPHAKQHKAKILQSQGNDSNCFTESLPNVSGTVGDQQDFPNTNGAAPSLQYLPNSNNTIAEQQYFPTGSGDGVATGQQSFPISSGTISNQQSPLGGNGTTASQQRFPNSSGADPRGYISTGDYQSPYAPLCAQPVHSMIPGQFSMEKDLFDDFDFDALLNDSQDPFQNTNWLDGIPSSNMGDMTSAVPETPNTWSPGQTISPSASVTPFSTGSSFQSPIELDDNDDVLPISQADLNVIDSIRVEQEYQPAKSPAKPQRNSPNKVTKPGIKYDIRGNPIGTATLPTVRYRKLAPRTAQVGALMFPASATPKDAAPGTTQHPNGG